MAAYAPVTTASGPAARRAARPGCLGGLGVDVAAAGVFERGPDLAAFSFAAEAGSGALRQQLEGVGASRSSKATSAAGKYSRSAWRSRST